MREKTDMLLHDPNQPNITGTWTGFIVTMSLNFMGGILYSIASYIENIDKFAIFILHLLGCLSVLIGCIVGMITLVDKLEARKQKKEGPKSPPQT